MMEWICTWDTGTRSVCFFLKGVCVCVFSVYFKVLNSRPSIYLLTKKYPLKLTQCCITHRTLRHLFSTKTSFTHSLTNTLLDHNLSFSTTDSHKHTNTHRLIYRCWEQCECMVLVSGDRPIRGEIKPVWCFSLVTHGDPFNPTGQSPWWNSIDQSCSSDGTISASLLLSAFSLSHTHTHTHTNTHSKNTHWPKPIMTEHPQRSKERQRKTETTEPTKNKAFIYDN